MEITWNHIALNAQQLKQRGITNESSVVVVSSEENNGIGEVARFALQSLGSLMIEINFPKGSQTTDTDARRNSLSDVLSASDFIVDCTGGQLETLLGNGTLNETETQILVHDNLDWVLAPSS